MSTDQVEVTFKCQVCGGSVLELPDDHTDDSIAKCKACGQEFGRWGDVKAKAKKAVAVRVMGDIKNAFKGIKGWKAK